MVAIMLLLVAAQCQAAPPANMLPTTQPPSPAPLLIPPIQPGDGTDLMDRLLETGVLRTGIRVWPEASFSPPAFRGFSNAETGGALNGFEIDIARLVAEGLGLELELIEAPPLVIAGGAWRGEWDIALASLAPFDQPLEGVPAYNMVYSHPYGYVPIGILLPESENNIQTLAHLSGRRVGVLEHSALQRLLTPTEAQLTVQGQPLLSQPRPDLQLVVLSNLLKAIRQLGQPEGADDFRLEALFGPAPILEEAVKRGFPVKLAPEAYSIGIQPLVIATVPQDGLKVERLISEINKILSRLQRDGTLAEIYLRWYGQDLSRPP
jgi:ABC-type amino acid transport substrate-binding protein